MILDTASKESKQQPETLRLLFALCRFFVIQKPKSIGAFPFLSDLEVLMVADGGAGSHGLRTEIEATAADKMTRVLEVEAPAPLSSMSRDMEKRQA